MAVEHVSSSLCKLEPSSETIGVDMLLNYNHHKYSMNAAFKSAFALKSASSLLYATDGEAEIKKVR